MNRHHTLFFIACAGFASAQGPILSSWILNPGTETGYNGLLSNVQEVHYTASDVYVSCTCIPGYDIGPWAGNPNTPANQDFCFRITRTPVPNTGTLVSTALGHIGLWRNGVSIFNAKDGMSYNNQGIWNRDAYVFEGSSFDACLGHPAPNGEYHHHVSPNCLYPHTDDEHHSQLIGFAFDGFPIYGAHGYTNTDGTGGISRMRSSYQLRTISDRTTRPDGSALQANQYGPPIGGAYPLGAFLEDYVYVEGSGDLDAHNGRSGVTPEYPEGTYAYFVTLTDAYAPAYPYVIGPSYYGIVPGGNTGPQSGHNTIPGDAVVYVNSTGISDDAALTMPVQVYPIPSTGALTIDLRSTNASTLALLDMAGRVVRNIPFTTSRIDLDLGALAAGTYQLVIGMTDGTGSSTRVLITR